jgi:hypothetical protein
MERFAAEGLKAQRDQNVKSALKNKVPWPDVMADYGLTLAEIMAISEKAEGLSPRADDLRDARDEPRGKPR